jgi:hypothetical protein
MRPVRGKADHEQISQSTFHSPRFIQPTSLDEAYLVRLPVLGE